MSGGTVRCMVDMILISHIPVSVTVVLMLRSSQVTVMADQQTFEDGRPREIGGVHAQPSVVHDRMTITVLQAAVARRNETETDILAAREVVGLQIDILAMTAVKNPGTVTVSDGATDRVHENAVTPRVEAGTAHTRVKTVNLGQQEIESHLLRTVGDRSRQN